MQLAKAAEKGVERFASANLEVENWQDAKIAADIAMKLHNVGQEGVQVNVCAAFAGMEEGPVVSISGDQEEDETTKEVRYFEDE